MRAGGTGPAGELSDFSWYGKATAAKATIIKIIQTARLTRFFIFTLVILSLVEAPLGTVASAQSADLGHPSQGQAVSTLLTQAGHLIQDNKLNDARQVLSVGLHQYPHEASLLNFLGVVDAKENKIQEAEENFGKAIVESPRYAGPYFNLAQLYLAQVGRNPNAISAAIRTYESLTSTDPRNVEALNELAILYERTGEPNQARSTLLRIAHLQPSSVAPLLELAQLANRQHDYRDALGYLAHARALDPKNARIHFFFGMVCIEAELHQEAYVSLKKAVALDPNNPDYNYALGAVLAQTEDSRQAIPYFQKYCALRPHDPRGALALGEAYYHSHALSVARATLLEVVGKRATAAGASYYLGRVAKDEGKWQEADRYFHDAIHYNPGYADAYAMIGAIYLHEKRYSECANTLHLALKLDPKNYRANLWLTALYEGTKDPRAEAQAQRLHRLQKNREEREKLFLRTIRVVP